MVKIIDELLVVEMLSQSRRLCFCAVRRGTSFQNKIDVVLSLVAARSEQR